MSDETFTPYPRDFLEHAVKARSQYDGTCRTMAQQILNAEARIAELTGALERAAKALDDDLHIFEQDRTAAVDVDGLRETIEAVWATLSRPSTGGGATRCTEPSCVHVIAGIEHSHATPADPGRLDPVEAIRETPCPDDHGGRNGCISQGLAPDVEQAGYFCAARIRASRTTTRAR